MRSWVKVAGCLCLVLSLAGCGAKRVAPPPGAPATTPLASTLPPSTTADPPLPAVVLWAPPGQQMMTGPTRVFSITHKPLKLGAYTLQPVWAMDGVLYLRQEGLDVYLHGTESGRGGLTLLPTPRLLYRLPLKAGDSWEIQFPGTVGQKFSYTVEAVEKIATPVGEQLAARISLVRAGKLDRQEWWVPGHGIVRIHWTGSAPEEVADREAHTDPTDAPTVAHPAPGLTAVLWDDGRNYWVTALESGRELLRVADEYWRSYYSWRVVGQQTLLIHNLVPGSWGVVRYDALKYSEQSGRLEPISWISSAGKQETVAGEGQWDRSGRFILTDFLGYPKRTYTYQLDGSAMRADPKMDQFKRADSAIDFARRLVGAPPLGRRDFVAMFTDAGEGEAAWKALKTAQWEPFGGGGVEQVSADAELTFRITDGQVKFLVRVVKGQDDFRIQTCELLQ